MCDRRMVRGRWRPGLVAALSAIACATAARGAPDPTDGSRRLMLGPVTGLSTAWQDMPIQLSVPVGMTLEFKVEAELNESVAWDGAIEYTRYDGWSYAQCPLPTPGAYALTVRAGRSSYFFTIQAARPAAEILVGPIEGLTTAWHPMPRRTAVPAGITLQLKVEAPEGKTVNWVGADPIGRDQTWSYAECPLPATGSAEIVAWIEADPVWDYSVITLQDVQAREISLASATVAASEFEIDETLSQDELNALTMEYYMGGSIAAIHTTGVKVRGAAPRGRPGLQPTPKGFLTSVDREIPVALVTKPAGFEPLMEWRINNEPAHLRQTLALDFADPGHYTVTIGPTRRARTIEFETYRTTIISHVSMTDIVPEGVSITFEAETDPPGYEDQITWLSSTKYGTADPVLGYGPTFTVQFDETFGLDPTRGLFQWLGVKADNVVFGQDQKAGACCANDGTCTETTQAACPGDFQGDGVPCAPDPCACTINITKITGARKNTVGYFEQLPNPDDPGRLFLDTIAGGQILADSDKQNVILEVQLGPATLDPTKYEVLWEARDPDDPADHKDVDPNDGGTPTGGTPKGGDNIDKKPADGVTHFFTKASFDVTDQVTIGSDGASAATVIGKGTTQVDANRKSDIKFNYGDEGGDSYIIKAICVKKATQAQEDSDSTGTQTVWRKRHVHVYAMKNGDDAQEVAFGAGTPAETTPVITAGLDGVLQTTKAGDDVLDGPSDRILAGPNKKCDTHAKHWYPANNLSNVGSIMHTSYANVAVANKNAYIDVVASDKNLAGTEDAQVGVGPPAADYAEWIAYLKANCDGANRPNNTAKLIGIREFTTADLGDSQHFPNSGIAVNKLPTLANKNKTSVHEVGHVMLPWDNQPDQNVNIHNNHSAAPHAACAGNQGLGPHPVTWCPKHAKIIRLNVTRSFNALPAAGAETTATKESARDSDEP